LICYAAALSQVKRETVRVAIVNIGTIVSGDLNEPLVKGDTIISDGDRIVAVGTAAASDVETFDIVIDADRTTAIPGLIDSHVHIMSPAGPATPKAQRHSRWRHKNVSSTTGPAA
jgi:imidazolonepropionase-like amidohydrolase